jgi:acylphosphatase
MDEVRKIHKNITINGRVQGVGFRYSAKKMALSLGITGFVKNMPNGDVYIEAEGSEVQLKHLLEWCYIGPSYAHVKDIEIEPADIKGFNFFEIIH